MNDAVKILVEKHGWNQGTAEAHKQSNGHCKYCGIDLLSSRLGYSSMQIDHLLPKSKYENEKWNIENWLTSCNTCNSMKGIYDPLEDGEDPVVMVSNSKDVLIERVKAYLKEGLDQLERERLTVRALIRS